MQGGGGVTVWCTRSSLTKIRVQNCWNSAPVRNDGVKDWISHGVWLEKEMVTNWKLSNFNPLLANLHCTSSTSLSAIFTTLKFSVFFKNFFLFLFSIFPQTEYYYCIIEKIPIYCTVTSHCISCVLCVFYFSFQIALFFFFSSFHFFFLPTVRINTHIKKREQFSSSNTHTFIYSSFFSISIIPKSFYFLTFFPLRVCARIKATHASKNKKKKKISSFENKMEQGVQ